MKNATVVSLNFSVCKQLWPKIFQTQGLSQEYVVQWPCPLFDRLSGLLRKIQLFVGCSVGFKYAKNALAAGAPPRTPLGKLTTFPSPRPIVGWGGGHQSQRPNPSAPIDSRAFGASILVPPRWKPGAPADLEPATVLDYSELACRHAA